jgi:outer membrane protein
VNRATILLLFGAALYAQPKRLTLTEAEDAALRNSPRIGAASMQALASRQMAPQVRSALYPLLSGNVTGAGAPTDTRIAAGAINNPAIFTRFATGLSASQLIYDFGRVSTIAHAAELRALSEGERERATRHDVILAVNRAFIAGLRAQAIVGIADETVAARQAIAEHAKALAEAKLKSELDVRFAQVAVGEARLLLETARNDRRSADADLSLLMGYAEPVEFDLVAEPARELPSTDVRRLIAGALARRPELAAARFELDAAAETVKSEKKLRWPAVSAVASFGVVPAAASGLEGKSQYAAIGLNIALPVLNGGLYAAREAEAEYRAGAARKRLDQTSYEIARDVTVTLIAAQSASERMALATQLVDQAVVALDYAQARYDLGLSSIVELSQAQLARTSAEIQSANARYDYQLQRAALAYHAGETR